MTEPAKFHWGRAVIGGIAAELCVFAIVFPALYLLGQRAFLASILIASAVMPFLFALWACKPAKSRFALHGLLVGVTAAVFYLILAHGQPEPLLYKIAHGLKLVGGLAGGFVAGAAKQRRKLSAA
jgi:membrane-bound metal-dependent hydrolase YbcI (DUF457 family)